MYLLTEPTPTTDMGTINALINKTKQNSKQTIITCVIIMNELNAHIQKAMASTKSINKTAQATTGFSTVQ